MFIQIYCLAKYRKQVLFCAARLLLQFIFVGDIEKCLLIYRNRVAIQKGRPRRTTAN